MLYLLSCVHHLQRMLRLMLSYSPHWRYWQQLVPIEQLLLLQSLHYHWNCSHFGQLLLPVLPLP